MIEKRPNLDLLQVPLYRLSMLTFRKATKLYSCLGDSELESFHKERKKITKKAKSQKFTKLSPKTGYKGKTGEQRGKGIKATSFT